MTTEGDDLNRKVAEWIESQGYPLEMVVATAFQKGRFSASLSDFYNDFETGDSREIDVTSFRWSNFDKPIVLQVCCRIECKLTRDRPWILFFSHTQAHEVLPINIAATERFRSFLIEKFTYSDYLHKVYSQPLLGPTHLAHGLTQAFTSRLVTQEVSPH